MATAVPSASDVGRARRVLTAVGIAVAVVVWVSFAQWHGNPLDALAYWGHGDNPYNDGGYLFLYSPPVAQAMIPLRLLPFEAFTALLRGAELVALVLLVGPASAVAIFLPPVAAELNAGNINLLLGACIAFGFRWPILWVPVLLTKPTAGIGLLWFVARRDWRALTLILAVTGGTCALSFVAAPDLWAGYVGQLLATDTRPGWPFPWTILERAPVFLPLVAWGALTGRKWAVVLGVVIAFPRLYFLSASLLLAVLPTLAAQQRQQDDRRVGLRVVQAAIPLRRRQRQEGVPAELSEVT